jgi:hypothetical protein
VIITKVSQKIKDFKAGFKTLHTMAMKQNRSKTEEYFIPVTTGDDRNPILAD